MKSIILTHSGYQDQECMVPYYRLQEEGTVMLVAEKVGKVRGILGTEIEATMSANQIDHRLIDYGDLLVIPGGVKAMEKLRQNEDALTFVRAWFNAGKPIASMCSGAQMLISARVDLRGRKLSAYPAMEVDVENAGAIFTYAEAVVDGNLISSPHYDFLSQWMKAAIEVARNA